MKSEYIWICIIYNIELIKLSLSATLMLICIFVDIFLLVTHLVYYAVFLPVCHVNAIQDGIAAKKLLPSDCIAHQYGQSQVEIILRFALISWKYI